MSYDHGNDPAFLPTNLRLGTAFTFPLADYHNLTFGLDLNKLLVPTRPREADYDTSTPDGQREYLDALERWENMSPITGIFKSFSDAPGGFSEELEGDQLVARSRICLQSAVFSSCRVFP